MGFSCVAQGFSLTCMRKWTFGAGCNHPAGVLQPFVLTRTSLCITLIWYFLGWYSQANLVLLSDHKKNKMNMAGLFKAG